jgi:hydroxyacylglutathione hydrolase
VDVKISSIQPGCERCYLIGADGVVVVDAGAKGKGKKLLRWMDRAGIPRHKLQLIIITHGHWDHIGGAKEIQEATGTRIVMHERNAPWLEGSLKPLSPGVTTWGRVFTGAMKQFLSLIHIPAAEEDIKPEGEFRTEVSTSRVNVSTIAIPCLSDVPGDTIVRTPSG